MYPAWFILDISWCYSQKQQEQNFCSAPNLDLDSIKRWNWISPAGYLRNLSRQQGRTELMLYKGTMNNSGLLLSAVERWRLKDMVAEIYNR